MRIEEHFILKEAAQSSISNLNPVPISIPEGTPMEEGINFGLDEKDREKRHGFGISAFPAAILGAIVGAAIQKKMPPNQIQPMVLPVTKAVERRAPGFPQNNYYDQMKHLSDNLKVTFTPVSVVYTVKDGGREIPLETVETDEMNSEMIGAWKDRDDSYFKNLLLNKMHSQIQFAEQAFAKQILESQMGINKAVNKNASVIAEPDFDDLTILETYHYASIARDFFQSENPIMEKAAEYVLDSIDDSQEYIIAEAVLDRPFSKYAGAVADMAALFPFGQKSKLSSDQGQYLNQSFLKNNIKVGFFPDRVIFIADGKLLGTLPAVAMNVEGYEHFKEQDLQFFKNYFVHEMRKGAARLNEQFPGNAPKQEKTAEEKVEKLSITDIFVDNDIHPVVYFLALTAKYGTEWVDYDNNALVAMIEQDFALTRPIGDIPLNKILSIKAANSAEAVYSSRHAFEKIIRAVNDKPIDFMARESEDLDLEDFAFGLDVLNRVTPYDNTYDNFTPEIYDYIVKVLADRENYVWGVNISNTDEEQQFVTILNYSLLNELNNRFCALVGNEEEEDDIIKENELIFETALKIINAAYQQMEETPEMDIQDFIHTVLAQSDIDSNTANIISQHVLKNVTIDVALDRKEQLLIKQLTDLGLYK